MVGSINIKQNLRLLEQRAFYYIIEGITDVEFPVPEYLYKGSSLSILRSELHAIHLQLFSMSSFVLQTILNTIYEDLYLLYEQEPSIDKHDPKWKTQNTFTAYVLHRFLQEVLSKNNNIEVPEYTLKPKEKDLLPTYFEYAFFCKLLVTILR